MKTNRDISPNVVAILLIVAIVVSAYGTWSILDAASNVAPDGEHGSVNGEASVRLDIGAAPEASMDSSTAAVTIRILEDA